MSSRIWQRRNVFNFMVLMNRFKIRLLTALRRQRPTIQMRNTQHLRRILTFNQNFCHEQNLRQAKVLLSQYLVQQSSSTTVKVTIKRYIQRIRSLQRRWRQNKQCLRVRLQAFATGVWSYHLDKLTHKFAELCVDAQNRRFGFLLSNMNFVGREIIETAVATYMLRMKLFQKLRFLTWMLHKKSKQDERTVSEPLFFNGVVVHNSEEGRSIAVRSRSSALQRQPLARDLPN